MRNTRNAKACALAIALSLATAMSPATAQQNAVAAPPAAAAAHTLSARQQAIIPVAAFAAAEGDPKPPIVALRQHHLPVALFGQGQNARFGGDRQVKARPLDGIGG